MTGRVEREELIVPETKKFFLLGDFCFDVKRLKIDVKAEGRREKLIGFFNDSGIEFMHNETGAKTGFEKMRAADMVHMAVGENEVFDLRGVKPCFFDVLNDAIEGEP